MNPSKRKQSNILTEVIEDIRECKKCKITNVYPKGDPEEFLLDFHPCLAHREKLRGK